MSDFEDDMDVDLDGETETFPNTTTSNKRKDASSIQFSAESSKKQKRIVADLPVSLNNSLPWVEKYRPNLLTDVSGHQDIISTITRFVAQNRLPHLLLYGPPGTGKTSTILALARQIYGPRNMRQMVLELNASDDRGIDVVREQIKTFASTKQIFSASTQQTQPNSVHGDGNQSSTGGRLAGFKLIILDEADAMTSAAQMALRRIMEKYTANTRFCIIANYTHKLSPALLSRCTRFRFSPLKPADVRRMVDYVIANERPRVNITEDAIDSLVTLSRGDMRRALNVLQACHAGSMPLPSDKTKHQAGGDGGTEDTEMTTSNGNKEEEEYEPITAETIYMTIASPLPGDIKTIMSTLLSNPDITSCLTTINALKATRGLALADILTQLNEELMSVEVPAATRVVWLEGLAEIEYRLAGGGGEAVQTGGMVSVIREGAELMAGGKKGKT